MLKKGGRVIHDLRNVMNTIDSLHQEAKQNYHYDNFMVYGNSADSMGNVRSEFIDLLARQYLFHTDRKILKRVKGDRVSKFPKLVKLCFKLLGEDIKDSSFKALITEANKNTSEKPEKNFLKN